MVDIIPSLKEHLPNLHIDLSLYDLPTLPYTGKNDTDAILFCMGFCLANDLKFIEKAGFVLMQANDIARVATLPSDISEETRDKLEGLEWDLIPYRGQYVIEYPMGHQDILDSINEIQNEQIKIQLIITSTSNANLLDKGIALEEYLQGYVNFFEFFTIKDASKWQTLNGGFRVDLSRKDVEEFLNDTTTLVSTSILGIPSYNAITQSVPYETYQRDPDGFLTSRNIEFIEAGLSITVTTKKLSEQYLTDFQIEISNLSSTNQLPLVSRRQSNASIILDKDKPILVASLFMNQMSNETRKGIFGSKTRTDSQSDQIHIFAKLL